MNYSYFYRWLPGCCVKDKNILKFDIDITSCPIFFSYGTKKAFMFHDDAWEEKLAQNEKDGGKCKMIAFDSDHWV